MNNFVGTIETGVVPEKSLVDDRHTGEPGARDGHKSTHMKERLNDFELMSIADCEHIGAVPPDHDS